MKFSFFSLKLWQSLRSKIWFRTLKYAIKFNVVYNLVIDISPLLLKKCNNNKMFNNKLTPGGRCSARLQSCPCTQLMFREWKIGTQAILCSRVILSVNAYKSLWWLLSAHCEGLCFCVRAERQRTLPHLSAAATTGQKAPSLDSSHPLVNFTGLNWAKKYIN